MEMEKHIYILRSQLYHCDMGSAVVSWTENNNSGSYWEWLVYIWVAHGCWLLRLLCSKCACISSCEVEIEIPNFITCFFFQLFPSPTDGRRSNRNLLYVFSCLGVVFDWWVALIQCPALNYKLCYCVNGLVEVGDASRDAEEVWFPTWCQRNISWEFMKFV